MRASADKITEKLSGALDRAITGQQHAGWIKLYRVALPWLRNHKLWAFWCYCLLKASRRVHKVFIGNQQVELSPGEKSDLVVENGTVIFERPINEKILKAIDGYNSGIAINVLLFSQTFKRRRAEMLIRKRGMEGRNA